MVIRPLGDGLVAGPSRLRDSLPAAQSVTLVPGGMGLMCAQLDGMFATHELELEVSFGDAQARLVNLAHGKGLSDASQDAYEGGLARLIRVGPLGDVPGASKLVRVRFLDPVYRDDAMTLGLRWEATGVSGGLFPVLDADITLTAAGEHSTRLALAGSYRPPLGRLGAELDRVILNQVATATIRALLQEVADALASPRPAAEHQAGPASSPTTRLVTDPEAPS
jgi:hypothetical protein